MPLAGKGFENAPQIDYYAVCAGISIFSAALLNWCHPRVVVYCHIKEFPMKKFAALAALALCAAASFAQTAPPPPPAGAGAVGAGGAGAGTGTAAATIGGLAIAPAAIGLVVAVAAVSVANTSNTGTTGTH